MPIVPDEESLKPNSILFFSAKMLELGMSGPASSWTRGSIWYRW